MRRPGGYAVWTDPSGAVLERDTITCGHCSAVIFTKPRTAATVYLIPQPPGRPDREEPGAMCGVCWRPVCLRCHADGRCTPLEARLAAMEGRLRRWKVGGRFGVVCVMLGLLSAPVWAQPPSDPPNSRTCANGGRSRACRTADGEIHVRDTRGRWKKLPKRMVKEADPLPNPDRAAADVVAPDGPVTMDVLFVVPSDVESALGGQDAVRAFAQLAVEDSNQAYATSGVDDRLRLAGVVFHTWDRALDASQSAATRLNALRLDATVAAQAGAYGADLIHGLVANGGTVCGVGYVGGEYSMADYRCQAQLSIPHEIGHNQGLHHDTLQGGAPDCGPASEAYNCGKGFPEFRTVMAYQGGPRVKVLSSPTAAWNGQTTGTAWEDNARALRENAPSVAARRDPPAVFGTAPSALTWIPAPTGTAPSNLAWTPGPAGTPPSNLTWQADPPQPPPPPPTTARLVYKVAVVPIEIEGSSQGRPQTEAQIKAGMEHTWWMLDSHNQATVWATVAPWRTVPVPASGSTCPFNEYYPLAAEWKQANCPDCEHIAIWIPWASCNPHAASYIGLTSDQLCCGSTPLHEMGHRFHLFEAQGEHCQTVNGALSCTSQAYDDKDDIMGSSISALGFAPPAKALTFGWAWYEGINGGAQYIPGQIIYDVANGPGEYWIEEQTIRTNLLHKALVLTPGFSPYFVSLDRGSVRIRTLGTLKDLDPISSVTDRSLDVGQSYDISGGGWGLPPFHWRITNIGFEGTGVRIRIEDITQ